MQTQRENSTLIALREVRSLEVERRRKEQNHQEAEARRLVAQVEETRRSERLAREAAMREQSLAAQRREEARLREEEVTRLQNELSQKENEITRLRQEGEVSRRALRERPVLVAPPSSKANPILWVACAVVSAVVLVMALGPSQTSPAPRSMPSVAMARPAPIAKTISPPPATTVLAPGTPVVEGRPKSPTKPHRPTPPTTGQSIRPPDCDGTDPLCGIDIRRISDEGKQRRGIR